MNTGLPRYLPWSLPAALALALGICLAATGAPAVLTALLALALLPPATARYLRVPSWTAWLCAAALCGGHGRYAAWEARTDPLAGLRGQEVTVSGRSDGRTLTLDHPAGARVAIAPNGALPAGQVVALGTLQEAAGKRNPGGFDYRAYLERRGIHGQLLVSELVSAVELAGARERLQRGVTAGLDGPKAAVMEAMTLGIKDHLGELRDEFAAAGLAHLLALSGLHLGVLTLALGAVTSPLGAFRYPVVIALVAAFTLVVGVSPSLLRAALMVSAVLLSLWTGAGRIQAWPALALAALGTLLFHPSWLFDLSFQLSYGAVAGILLFAVPLAPRVAAPALPWWHPRKLVGVAALTSVAAQLPTLPLVAGAFGGVPLFSPLVNVLAVPLATLLVPLGFAAGLLGLVWAPLATLLNQLTGPLAGLLLAIAGAAAHLPVVPWGEVTARGHLYYAVAQLALALAVAGRLRAWRSLAVALAALAASYLTPSPWPTPEFVALDVGQGDSFLIRLPGRVEILVDGGGTPFSDFDVGARTVVPALLALGVDELELVVATHPDADHIEGLLSVLRLMPVQELVIGVDDATRPLQEELLAVARDRGVRVRRVRRGQVISVGGADLHVLNPPAVPYGPANDDSVALAVRWGGAARLLLLGDVSARVERELAIPPAAILVAPHHGSATSTSEDLVRAASPTHAVVSVGRNGYGHPRPEVFARLAAAGATVHQTIEAGAVRLPLVP